MIASVRFFLLASLLMLNTGFVNTSGVNFDSVKTNAGLVSGTVNKEGDIHIFKGIPFAAPPTGNLRWQAPQPVKPWDGVRKCDAFAAQSGA